MALALVRQPDYHGVQGATFIYAFKEELAEALAHGDWQKVRRLDQACSELVEKVVAANADISACVVQALKELRDFYAELLGYCREITEQTF